MIKVKLSKKTLNEIERGSYQEKFTTGGGETKTTLNNIFNGKVRIFFPINLSYGEISTNEQISGFIDDNANALRNQFTNLLAIPVEGEREDVTARKDKIRKDPVRNFLINQLPPNIKKLSDDDKEDIERKTQGLINAYSRLMKEYFPRIIHAAKAVGAIVKFDFDKKLIVIQKSGETKVSATRLPVFMNLLTQVTEVFNNALINLAESNETEKIRDPDFWKQIYEKINNNPVITRFAKYFIAPSDPIPNFLYTFKDVITHPRIDLTRIDLFQEATIVKNEMVFKLSEKYLFDFASSSGKGSNYIVLTRVPRDVVRMSDFPGLESCHSPVYADEPDKAEERMYASCATQEASSKGGAVAYLFKNLKFKPEEISKLETSNEEFMDDPRRNIDGDVPISRLRIRTVGIFDDAGKEIIVHVPDSRMYGKVYESFTNLIHGFLKQNQTSELSTIDAMPQEVEMKLYGGGYPDVKLHQQVANFIGGKVLKKASQQEFPRSYEDNIGKSIEKINKDYEEAIENALSQKAKDVISLDIESEKELPDNISTYDVGYFSGHPRPEEIETRVPDITVQVKSSINLVSIVYFLQDKYPELLPNTLNKKVHAPTRAFKDFIENFGFKVSANLIKQIDYFDRESPRKIEIKTYVDNINTFVDELFFRDLLDKDVVKRYFDIDFPTTPEPLQESRKIYVKLYRS